MARAALVALLAVLGVAAGAEDGVGAKNLETARKIFEISKELQDASLTPTVIEKLIRDCSVFYAPKVDCSLTPSSALGFEMRGVLYAECSAGYAKAFRGIKADHIGGAEYAVVAGSGGKVLLVLQTFEYTVAATGEVVSTVNVGRLGFNDEGLVVSDSELFDTSTFGGATLAAAVAPATGAAGAAWAAGGAFIAGVGVTGAFMMRAARRHQPEPLLHGYEGLAA